MPIMSSVEGTLCRTPVWNWIAATRMLPWALGVEPLDGDVLEIGCGAGAMAEAVAAAYPAVSLTATDLDPRMVDEAQKRLGASVDVSVADVTALQFPSDSFDVVTSYLMLHHVIAWPDAVAEAARVLRPGGAFRGYDLTDTRAARWFHKVDRSPFKMVAPLDLEASLRDAGFTDVQIETAAAGHLMRFTARR